MLFTFVYGAVAALDSGPFFAQNTDGTPSLRLYFSYVTLATLGYGDYTAASTLGPHALDRGGADRSAVPRDGGRGARRGPSRDAESTPA
jgi:hypothetical protein